MIPKLNLSILWHYFLYGSSFFGCYHMAQMMGYGGHLSVDSINISPSQAEVIQADPDYYTDNAQGIRTKRKH